MWCLPSGRIQEADAARQITLEMLCYLLMYLMAISEVSYLHVINLYFDAMAH